MRTTLNVKGKGDNIKLDAIWCKTFVSFVKMKVRKGLPSRELWLYTANNKFINILVEPFWIDAVTVRPLYMKM